MEKTMKTGKLGGLGVGSRFVYGGVEWAILERRAKVALCLAADVLEERAFDEENKNDFAASSIRAYLNGEFMKKMVEAGASEDAFVPIVLDLTADDGLEKYGQDRAKIALLTCDMYRRFRAEIPEIEKWWWLATADSPRNNFARLVNTDGASYYYFAYYGYSGVRPLCRLKSDISVSYDEEQIKEYSGSRFADMIGKMIIDGLREGLESSNKNIKADNIKIEAAEGDEARKRAEAVDMMRHIAAAFDIPATIDGDAPAASDEENNAEYAKELYAFYADLLNAGFEKPQAWEIFMHNVHAGNV